MSIKSYIMNKKNKDWVVILDRELQFDKSDELLSNLRGL